MSQPPIASVTNTEVWVLRESFLAYERFHGVFATKEAAQKKAGDFIWAPVKSRRKLPSYMWDDLDPFDSDERAVSSQTGSALWVVEPRRVEV